MKLLDEIHHQPPFIRLTMYWLSVATVLGAIGFFWFTSLEKEMFFAVHPDQNDRVAFLARQEERTPQPLALIARGFDSLTASIGSLLGFDRSRGFDKNGQADHTQDSVYLLPLSQ